MSLGDCQSHGVNGLRDALLAGVAHKEVRAALLALPVGLAEEYRCMRVNFPRHASELPNSILGFLPLAALTYRLSSRISNPPALRVSPRPPRRFTVMLGVNYPPQGSAGQRRHRLPSRQRQRRRRHDVFC